MDFSSATLDAVQTVCFLIKIFLFIHSWRLQLVQLLLRV